MHAYAALRAPYEHDVSCISSIGVGCVVVRQLAGTLQSRMEQVIQHGFAEAFAAAEAGSSGSAAPVPRADAIAEFNRLFEVRAAVPHNVWSRHSHPLAHGNGFAVFVSYSTTAPSRMFDRRLRRGLEPSSWSTSCPPCASCRPSSSASTAGVPAWWSDSNWVAYF